MCSCALCSRFWIFFASDHHSHLWSYFVLNRSRLLSNLKYVVVDEGHAYKGKIMIAPPLFQHHGRCISAAGQGSQRGVLQLCSRAKRNRVHSSHVALRHNVLLSLPPTSSLGRRVWVPHRAGAAPPAPPVRPCVPLAGGVLHGKQACAPQFDSSVWRCIWTYWLAVAESSSPTALACPLFAQPTFAVTTATVANPREHACELLGVRHVTGVAGWGN